MTLIYIHHQIFSIQWIEHRKSGQRGGGGGGDDGGGRWGQDNLPWTVCYITQILATKM